MKEEHIFWSNGRVEIKEIDENSSFLVKWYCTKERINERGPYILIFLYLVLLKEMRTRDFIFLFSSLIVGIRRQDKSKIPLPNPRGGKLLLRPPTRENCTKNIQIRCFFLFRIFPYLDTFYAVRSLSNIYDGDFPRKQPSVLRILTRKIYRQRKLQCIRKV